MRKLFTLCLLVFSLSASAQWQQTGSKVRYVNGLGIPTRDTAAGVAADSSQIVIRPADSALYVKYKRTWLRVGGTGFTGSGTTNYVPKFTSSTAIGNSQIFDNGTFVGVNKTTLSGIYVFQVNGGIQSTSAGFPFQFHSTSNVNYNSFFSNNTTFFGAIGNYTGLISGGVPGDKRDSILTTLSVNDMSFATGGAFERVRITSGGQLNVGGQFTQTTNTLNVVGNIQQVDAIAGVQTAIKTVFTPMTLLTANSAIGTETAHDLALITANTTRANLTSSGQFNIGGNYASTNNTLQVAGNAAIGYTTAAPANGLLVNGSVGIGTSSPQNTLHVVNGSSLFENSSVNTTAFATAQAQLINTGAATTNQRVDLILRFQDGTYNGTGGVSMVRESNTARSSSLVLSGINSSGNGTETLLINSGGNIGINLSGGATNNAYGITSNGDATTNTGGIAIRQNGTDVMYIGNIAGNNTTDFEFWNPRNGYTRFGTNNLERMRITSSGRTLINTTTDNGVDQLQVSGSIQGNGFNQAYTAKTTTYTATTSDYFIDCTTGTFTVNLFTAVGNTGRILIIKNSGAGTITVDPNSSETIDGSATQTLSTQWSRVHIISDGANWKIISN